MSDSARPLESRREGEVLVLVLSRPDRLNAVSAEMYTALAAELEEAADDATVRAIVLTGAGRAFCAGADLKAHAAGARSDAERKAYIDLGQHANRLIQGCPRAVVAAVNGPAIGAGLELALSADFVLVAADARLRLPEVALGTFPGGGVMATLPERAGLARAKELILLGDFFTGEDAARWGLANAALPAATVLPQAIALARRLAAMAPVSLSHAKDLLNRGRSLGRAEIMRLEAEALDHCMRTEDWAEGVASFAERRAPRFRGV
jgi:enoyl-CoA hydratase/carnithine racemase